MSDEHQPDPPRRTMQLLEWREVRRNTLVGFATVALPIGLVIRDITVHNKGGARWASMPAKPVLDGDGKHHVVDGRRQYTPVVEWRDRALAEEFSRRLVALIE